VARSRRIVYTLGYPRSGTTWFARLLGDALNSPVGGIVPADDRGNLATEGHKRSGRFSIRHGHVVPMNGNDATIPNLLPVANLTTERIMIMVRDPRDVTVSAAHYWDMDIEKALHCMGRGEGALEYFGAWSDWMHKWEHAPIAPEFVKYEDLSKDTHGVMTALLQNLQVKRPRYLRDIIQRQSIDERRKYTVTHGAFLNYGTANQLKHLRKGIVGDWENHFTPEHEQLAQSYFGDDMQRMGYA